MNRDFTPGEWAIPIELAREPDFRLGKIVVRPSTCEIEAAAVSSVEPRVMQALVALAQRKGAVVSRDELIQRCWNARVVGDDAINRCIAKVRRLAELDGGASFAIETIPRVGYRLTVTVIVAEAIASTAPPNAQDAAQTRLDAPASRKAFPATGGAFWQAVWLSGAVVVVAAVTYAAISYRQLPVGLASTSIPVARISPAPVVAGETGSDLPNGAAFSDCAKSCPDMIVVPAGYFVMGAPQGEVSEAVRARPSFVDNASPQHEVLIGHKFAMARFDVTREQYARFVSETGRPDAAGCWTLTRAGTMIDNVTASWHSPGFSQTARDPVVCVSRPDAIAYAEWLSRKTHKPYRLPSEAEWEYTAHAGHGAPLASISPAGACRAFNGADADYVAIYAGDKYADAACHDGFAATSPVGTFPANAFGLYDMLGNAAQWVSDCYHPTYDGAPVDGTSWNSGDCNLGIVRGGYWALDSRVIRITRRDAGAAGDRFNANGFRVARDL